MKSVSAEELLRFWEHGQKYSLLNKTLLLLQLVYPELEPNNLAELSIGERDKRLLHLRNSIFGPFLQNTIDCPECNSGMEWEMDLHDIITKVSDRTVDSSIHHLSLDNFQIGFRLPNSRDIIEVLSENSNESGTNSLLKLCILDIKHSKGKSKIKELPENITDALSEKIAELDPAANIRMNITCPGCSYQWEATFDIMSYLWAEIDNWAHRTFQEVYILASTFGWSEKDILTMDAGRRQLYVEMIRS